MAPVQERFSPEFLSGGGFFSEHFAFGGYFYSLVKSTALLQTYLIKISIYQKISTISVIF
jgi:hypothetical protein